MGGKKMAKKKEATNNGEEWEETRWLKKRLQVKEMKREEKKKVKIRNYK